MKPTPQNCPWNSRTTTTRCASETSGYANSRTPNSFTLIRFTRTPVKRCLQITKIQPTRRVPHRRFLGWVFLLSVEIEHLNAALVRFQPMRNYLSLIFLLAVAVSVSGQDTKPAADRVAAQNAIFDDYYESELRNFPERATAFGDYRYNDKLDDYSLDGVMQHHKTDESFLA